MDITIKFERQTFPSYLIDNLYKGLKEISNHPVKKPWKIKTLCREIEVLESSFPKKYYEEIKFRMTDSGNNRILNYVTYSISKDGEIKKLEDS